MQRSVGSIQQQPCRHMEQQQHYGGTYRCGFRRHHRRRRRNCYDFLHIIYGMLPYTCLHSECAAGSYRRPHHYMPGIKCYTHIHNRRWRVEQQRSGSGINCGRYRCGNGCWHRHIRYYLYFGYRLQHHRCGYRNICSSCGYHTSRQHYYLSRRFRNPYGRYNFWRHLRMV